MDFGKIIGVRLASPPGASSQLRNDAIDAYLFGYPAVLMDLARRTGGEQAGHVASLPNARFVHERQLADPEFEDFNFPTLDSLYSVACLDLRGGPMVLSLPEMDGRAHRIQLIDAWSNLFATLGDGHGAGGPREIAILGPGWSGSIPLGAVPIQAPTRTVWVIGRIHVSGPDDVPAVRGLQDRCQLRELGVPTADGVDPARGARELVPSSFVPRAADRLAQFDARGFFNRLATLTATNPPPPEDTELLDRMARIGVRPGSLFVPEALGPRAPLALAEAIRTAHQMIVECPRLRGWRVQGWNVPFRLGPSRTDYLLRAAVARARFGLGIPEDAIDVHASLDADGVPLNGSRAYRVRLPAGPSTGAGASWSLTAYDAHHRLVDSPTRRHALGACDPLRPDQDRAVTVLLQRAEPPPRWRANWLPIPDGPFSLVLRLYAAAPAFLEGRWTPPAVNRRAVLATTT